MGFLVDRIVTVGRYFSENFGFPLQTINPPVRHTDMPLGADEIDPLKAAVRRDGQLSPRTNQPTNHARVTME
jgi:hypothetical protein